MGFLTQVSFVNSDIFAQCGVIIFNSYEPRATQRDHHELCVPCVFIEILIAFGSIALLSDSLEDEAWPFEISHLTRIVTLPTFFFHLSRSACVCYRRGIFGALSGSGSGSSSRSKHHSITRINCDICIAIEGLFRSELLTTCRLAC